MKIYVKNTSYTKSEENEKEIAVYNFLEKIRGWLMFNEYLLDRLIIDWLFIQWDTDLPYIW